MCVFRVRHPSSVARKKRSPAKLIVPFPYTRHTSSVSVAIRFNRLPKRFLRMTRPDGPLLMGLQPFENKHLACHHGNRVDPNSKSEDEILHRPTSHYTMKVTDTIIEQLIVLVQRNPCLYDVRRKEHKDAILISNVWVSIAAVMGAEEMNG